MGYQAGIFSPTHPSVPPAPSTPLRASAAGGATLPAMMQDSLETFNCRAGIEEPGSHLSGLAGLTGSTAIHLRVVGVVLLNPLGSGPIIVATAVEQLP